MPKPTWNPNTKRLLIRNARLSFPHIFEKWAKTADQTQKYSASLIFERGTPQARDIITAFDDMVREVFKQKPGQVRTVLHDGAEKAGMDGYGEGLLYINANSERRPLVVDRDGSALTKDDGRPYGGCYVNALVQLWAQNNQFGKRINAELLGVQFARDGEPFVGGAPASVADFELEGEEADDFDDDDAGWLR